MEDKLVSLQRELCYRENENKKDKAVYEQRISLLEMQLEECKKREQHQRQLCETIMSALNDVSRPQNKIFKDLLMQMESTFNDSQKQEIVKEYEQKCRQYQKQCDDLESQLNNQTIAYNKLLKQSSELEQQHQTQIDKSRQIIHDLELRLEQQTKEFHNDKEIMVNQIKSYQDQLKMIFNQHQNQIEQINSQHANEKESLNQRIAKFQNLIKKYQTHMEQNRNMQEVENLYQQEIAQLKKQIDQLEYHHELEKKQLQQQFEDTQQIVKSLELQVSILKQKRNNDDIRSSSIMKENIPIRYESSHKKLSNGNHLVLSKIENLQSSPMTELFNHESPRHHRVDSKHRGKPQAQISLQLPEHIHIKGRSFHQSDSDIDTLPMPYEDYKKKRSNNQTLSLNENISSMGEQWPTEQPSNRQSGTQQKSSYDFSRKVSLQSLKQSSRNDCVKSEYGVDDVIHESSLEGPSLPRFRGFSQIVQKSQSSNKKLKDDKNIVSTTRINDNHLNHHATKLKARYNPDDLSEQVSDASNLPDFLANVSSKQSNDSQVNQEIKYLIGKLLKAKGKLTEGLMNHSQSQSMVGKSLAVINQSGLQGNQSFYAQHQRKALANQSVTILPKNALLKPRHQKIKSNGLD